MFVKLNYENYSAEDHETWSKLYRNLMAVNRNFAASEYLDGLDKLQFSEDRVVDIEKLSNRLEKISGWRLLTVNCLVPTRDFFFMLINKQYPITTDMRKPHEIGFAELPDVFHDVVGHVPLLTCERFYNFLTAFSTIALKYIDNEAAVLHLGRLYWYTFEMGLVYEQGEVKSFGGAILTSLEESYNFHERKVPVHPFDIERIYHTEYDNLRLQERYFVLDSFDVLEACVKEIEHVLLKALNAQPVIHEQV